MSALTAPAPAPRSRAARRTVPPAAAVTAAIALLAAALLAAVTGRLAHEHAVRDARTAAVAAASRGVATVLSYDYRHLDGDFAQAERLLTPRFRRDYDKTTASAVKPLAAQAKAVSTAVVSAAGVVQDGTGRVVVLVFVDQTVTNTQLAAPRLDRSRIDVTLVQRGGRWLIDRLNPV